MYEVMWQGPGAHGLLRTLAPYLIIKRHFASQAMVFHTASLSTQERRVFVPIHPSPCSDLACVLPPAFPEEVFWAYMAGFVDAEGCIHLTTRDHDVLLRIGNTHRCVLLFLRQHALASGSVTSHPATSTRMTAAHELSFYNQRCATVLTHILPFLHIKRQQAELVLDFFAHRKTCDVMPYQVELSTLNRRGLIGQLSLFQIEEKT